MGLNEFIFETFDEANDIHKQLFKICREKGYVTCADLLSLTLKDALSVETIISKDIYHTHGWMNLWDVKVEPVEDCANGEWILRMPQVKILKCKGE